MRESIKLFIVDDHIVIRESLKAYLSRISDIEIVGEASNGEDAVDSLVKTETDVVLTDVFMPVMNGCEMVSWLKINKPSTKILVMSINNQDQFVLKLCMLGMNGYFLKDDNVSHLPDAIRQVADGWYFLSEKINYSVLTEDYLIRTYLVMNALNSK